MNKLRFSLFTGAAFLFSLALCATAQAQSRVFVSSVGSDANPCTRTAPCRTFQKGHDTVAAGGEVVALDAAGYGEVTITKSVTITGAGVYAGIVATSVDAITVNAASAVVVLRGLTLNGLGAANGINATAVGALHIEGCIVNGFSSRGINVALTADLSEIFIKDTISRNNGAIGISITTTTGTVRASIDGCRAENNGNHGFAAFNRSRVTVSNSVASGNVDTGFIAFSGVSGATAELNAEHCVASNNGFGFDVQGTGGGTATMRVARSTATNNTTGFGQFAGGTFESLGDNLVRGNTTNTAGTITVVTGS